MKRFAALLLLLFASACFADARDWKPAIVIGVTVTNVSGPLVHESNILHYTVETEDMVLYLEYSYHPSTKEGSADQHSKNGAPNIAMNEPTKIAISGHHAYLLDTSGSQVKMHIKKKTKK